MQKQPISDSPETREIVVGMGEMQVVGTPCLLKAVGVGSCVTVTLYDKHTRVGGLAHIMIPSIAESRNRAQPGKFADVAIDSMIAQMKRHGVPLHNIQAKIYGGANMFPDIIAPASAMDIGNRNILSVKDELAKHNIGIIAQDVGGHIGRSVSLDTRNGLVVVKTVQPEAKNI